MDLAVVLAVGAGCAAVAAFAGWRGARPPDLRRGPRLTPWRMIMVLTAAGAVAMLGAGLRMAMGMHPSP
jgi:type VI protein secretion system component VasF